MSRNTNNNSSTFGLVESLEGRRMFSVAADVPMQYDINRDGDINGDDFFVLDQHMNQEVKGWANGDINNSGRCDSTDAELLTGAYDRLNGIEPANFGEVLIARPGDINADGEVNADDLFVLDSSGPDHAGGWADGDLNGDGSVDHKDKVIGNAVGDGVVDADEYFELDSLHVSDSVNAFYA